MSKHIIVWGNPVTGLRFAGPFSSPEVAETYAEKNAFLNRGDWWLSEIEPAPVDGDKSLMDHLLRVSADDPAMAPA